MSVVHRDAVLADAWATGLAVLGPEAGRAVAEAAGLGAYFILRTGSGGFEVLATSGFPGVRDVSAATE